MKLDIKEFGQHLLNSNDLDPVYVALPKTIQDKDQMSRWLITYWCFYHCGVASYISERTGQEFWDTLAKAAVNDTNTPLGARWPRGSERRHARGQQSINMVNDLYSRYSEDPKSMLDYLFEPAPSYEKVAGRVKEHHLFGNWISFKVADMADRVLGIPIDFSEAVVFMFDDPVKAALMLHRKENDLPADQEITNKQEVIHGIVEKLKVVFKDYKAPPGYERPVGLQEIETILCKWKSHMNNHYPLNNDIKAISEDLKDWSEYSSTAKLMLENMPKELPLCTM